MKRLLIFFVTLFLTSSCFIITSELQRTLIVSIRNDSGLEIKQFKLIFRAESGSDIDNVPIVVNKIVDGSFLTIKYNLENIRGFQEISAVGNVEFSNSNKNLEKLLKTFDNRRTASNLFLTIKKDTIISDGVNKR